jgi:S-adenosylmethionine decarboxylase
MNSSGYHSVADLYECATKKLDDDKFLMKTLKQAAKVAGMKVLGEMSHKFTPHGFTGILLLAESHISIHTYPENNYAAVDIYACGEADVNGALRSIEEALKPGKVTQSYLIRGRS